MLCYVYTAPEVRYITPNYIYIYITSNYIYILLLIMPTYI